MKVYGYLILFLWILGFQESMAEDIYMVSAQSSPWKNVSKQDLRDLFIGKTKSLDRVPCTPLVLAKEPDYSLFIREVVKKTPQSFERHWKKLLFSGKATLPMRCENLDDVYRLLKENET